jgi:hypothetical protein
MNKNSLIMIFFLLIIALSLSSCSTNKINHDKYSCCTSCIELSKNSPAAIGPEAMLCGQFNSALELSDSCDTFFKSNSYTVKECSNVINKYQEHNPKGETCNKDSDCICTLSCPDCCGKPGQVWKCKDSKCGLGQEDLSCAKEGEEISHDIQNFDECCTGLSEIRNYEIENDKCLITLGVTTCSNCGNGVCGLGENKCNCPEDCNSECVKKGEYVDTFSKDSFECCSGLVKISASPPMDKDCNPIIPEGSTGYEPGWTCLPCGDGICEKEIENTCNCPEDCSSIKQELCKNILPKQTLSKAIWDNQEVYVYSSLRGEASDLQIYSLNGDFITSGISEDVPIFEVDGIKTHCMAGGKKCPINYSFICESDISKNCDNLNYEESINSCYLQYAMSRNNSKLCDYITDNQKLDCLNKFSIEPDKTYLTLVAYPDLIPVNKEQEITFIAQLSGSEDKPEVLYLVKNQGTVAELYDNGEDSDLFKDDYMFTGTYKLSGSQEEVIEFHAMNKGLKSDIKKIYITEFPVDSYHSNTKEKTVTLNGNKFIRDEVLVCFKSGTSSSRIREIASEINVEIVDVIFELECFQLKIPDTIDGSGVYSTIKQLIKYKEVESAEPNYITDIG